MITISLRGLPLPCPLNALFGVMHVRKGKRMIPLKVTSKRGRERKQLVVAAMLELMGGVGPRIDRPCQLTYTITPRDRRTPDVDAYEKQLLDCLAAAGVVTDDKMIVQISKERMPNPSSPGCIDLELTELP